MHGWVDALFLRASLGASDFSLLLLTLSLSLSAEPPPHLPPSLLSLELPTFRSALEVIAATQGDGGTLTGERVRNQPWWRPEVVAAAAAAAVCAERRNERPFLQMRKSVRCLLLLLLLLPTLPGDTFKHPRCDVQTQTGRCCCVFQTTCGSPATER